LATKEQKVKDLEKILTSDVFQDKQLYQNLLRYLVDASFKGITPKEITVAQEVFNKGPDFNTSEDASVRVHMHNLRNKLDQYYQTEGMSDTLKLYIPKGHYKVEFRENKDTTRLRKRDRKNVIISILSFILVLLMIYIVLDSLVFQRRSSASGFTNKNNQLWTNFFGNAYSSQLIIGDFLIFHEYHDKLDRNRRIMDYEINTAEELEEYIQNNPEVYPQPWNLGELPHNVIYNILDLYPVFQSFGQRMDIRFSSEIDIDVIKKRNLIYVGEFKNLRALLDLVTALPIEFETLPWWHGTLSYQQGDSTVTLNTSRDWEKSRYVTDLGLLAMLPGQNQENYLIIAGFGYDAQIKIVEIVCKKESLQRLERQIKDAHGEMPNYFVMAFEVKGFDRASTTAELLFFAAIDKEQYLQDLVPSQ
jgi:hypothetical protein